MVLGPLQQKWVDTLRSGEYKQGTRFLSEQGKFCCLGVACEIASISKYEEYGHVYYDGSSVIAPKAMQDKYKFKSQTGKFLIGKEPDLPLEARTLCELTALNDHGVSFDRIADLIEKYADELFAGPV